MLGVEYHNNEIVLKLTEPIQMKIFNIFYKKDAPFHYNLNSNNGWLEVFIWGMLEY